MSISVNLRQQVIEAAKHRCEYCQTSSRLTGTPLVMEHILPRSQGDQDAHVLTQPQATRSIAKLEPTA